MKRLWLIFFTLLFDLGVLAQTQAPAPPAPRFALIEYFKIEPGKAADYRKLEQEVWMPLHRERVKQGLIKSWWAWSVQIPGGTAREYDRVIVTTFEKFADVENAYPPDLVPKVFPHTTMADLVVRTRALANLVRSEYVQIAESVTATNNTAPPKYASIHYIQPELSGGYGAVLRQYWKPLQQERVKRGILRGWVVSTVRYPAGSNKEYNIIAASFFDKLSDLETEYPADIWEKVHPGVKPAEIQAKSNAVRKTPRTELLRLVDIVQ